MENKDKKKLTETQLIERLEYRNVEKEEKEEEEPVTRQPSTPTPPQEPSSPTATSEVFSFVKDLIVCIVAVFLVTNFIVRPVQVEGNSMYPTLHDKSIGVSNTLGYHISKIERFDIVIIYVPEKNEYLVKRVIGLPGETVSYSNGQLYINGEQMDEPFLNQAYVEEYGATWMSDVSEITLGEDEYYCLGDNRPHSSDSRYYGPFKKENIRSKGIFIVWPFSDFGAQTW